MSLLHMSDQHIYHPPLPSYPTNPSSGWFSYGPSPSPSHSHSHSSHSHSHSYNSHHSHAPPQHSHHSNPLHETFLSLVELKRGWEDNEHRRRGEDDGERGEDEEEAEGKRSEDEGGFDDEDDDGEARRGREEDEETLMLSEDFLAGTADPAHSIIATSCMRSRDAAEVKVINSLTLVGIITRIVKKVIQKSPVELVFSKQMFIRNNWLSKQTYAIGFKAKLITMFLVTTIQQYQMLDADESDLSTLHRVRVLPKAFMLAKIKLPRTIAAPPPPTQQQQPPPQQQQQQQPLQQQQQRQRRGPKSRSEPSTPRQSHRTNKSGDAGDAAEETRETRDTEMRERDRDAREGREGMEASVVEVVDVPPSNDAPTSNNNNSNNHNHNHNASTEHDTEEEEDKSSVKKNGYTPHTPRTPQQLQRNASDPNIPSPNTVITSPTHSDTNSVSKLSELDIDTEEEGEPPRPLSQSGEHGEHLSKSIRSVRGSPANGHYNGMTRATSTRQLAVKYDVPPDYVDDFGYQYYQDMYHPNKKARTRPPMLTTRHMSHPHINMRYSPPTPAPPPPPPSERDNWLEFLSRVGRTEESVKGWPQDALREELELQGFRGARKGDVMNTWRSLQQA